MMLSKFKRIAVINKYNYRYVIMVIIINSIVTFIIVGATKVNPKESTDTIPMFGPK